MDVHPTIASSLGHPHKVLACRAPAKVNLSLKVTGRRADGHHLLESLVAFAGVGDELRLTHHGEPGLTISGPQSGGLAAGAGNLVLRASRHLLTLKPGLWTGHFHLVKRLPVASGIGGGSSDAGAALRLLARLNGLRPDDPALMEAARLTGADVPVCLEAKTRMMSGIGEKLGPRLTLPRLFAVLVNPGVPVATASVFAGLAHEKDWHAVATGDGSPATADVDSLLGWLQENTNDLEAPALSPAPVISDVLQALRGLPGCRLARMSGSGATCFGLFQDCAGAARAARSLASTHAGWWVKPTILR